MASNGASVLRLVEISESPSAPTAASDDPAPTPAPAPEDPIEQKIAEATADVVMTICRSVCEYAAHGMMDPETKVKTGDNFLRWYELQGVVGEHNFPTVARRQGKALVRQRYATLRQPGDPDFDEALIDDFLGHALDILKRVTETEKIYQAAWLN